MISAIEVIPVHGATAMTIKIEDIRAWIDGELDEPRACRVGQAVLFDEKLQRTANKLRASQLPYCKAYAQSPVPSVPSRLRVRIQTFKDSDF